MGISLSSESQHINSTKKPIRSTPDRISSELLKKNFSQIESYSLKTCFDTICTVNKDGIAHIDEESFVKYLSFADNIGVGPLIFRSFSYLANYPSAAHTPSLLTFNGLVKAIAIYCDKIKNVIDEDYSKLLFESFATWEDDESCKEFLSLDKNTTTTTIKFPKVKCQDLIDILTAIVWVTTCEMITANAESGNFMEILSNMISLKNISQIRDAVTPIVYSISKPDTMFITWPKFKSFICRNAPNMFRSWSSFFYGQFFIGQTLSRTRKDSLFFGPPVRSLPVLDSKSDLLSPINMAFLSWMPLPDHVFNRRQWNRLYTSTKHGFSMSSFSTNVFKYHGPTLMLIHAIVITDDSIGNNDENDTILLGAYISESWNSSKPFGSEECLLFEIFPTYESFPATNHNSNYVYYNTSSGIGFGGTDTVRKTSRLDNKHSGSFILQLDNTLQNGTYRSDSLKGSHHSYKLSATRTYFDIQFEVLEIQVFGLGGETAKQRQDNERIWEENLANRKRFRQYSSNAMDKEMLKLASIIDHGYRREVDTA